MSDRQLVGMTMGARKRRARVDAGDPWRGSNLITNLKLIPKYSAKRWFQIRRILQNNVDNTKSN